MHQSKSGDIVIHELVGGGFPHSGSTELVNVNTNRPLSHTSGFMKASDVTSTSQQGYNPDHTVSLGSLRHPVSFLK